MAEMDIHQVAALALAERKRKPRAIRGMRSDQVATYASHINANGYKLVEFNHPRDGRPAYRLARIGEAQQPDETAVYLPLHGWVNQETGEIYGE